MLEIDIATAFGARVLERLENDLILWLVTVDGKGTPHPSPVWFSWTDGKVIIYSLPNTGKLKNIDRQPRVALHFDSDHEGEEYVVFTGVAQVDPAMPPANEQPGFSEKYSESIAQLGWTNESHASDYHVAVVVELMTLRGQLAEG